MLRGGLFLKVTGDTGLQSSHGPRTHQHWSTRGVSKIYSSKSDVLSSVFTGSEVIIGTRNSKILLYDCRIGFSKKDVCIERRMSSGVCSLLELRSGGLLSQDFNGLLKLWDLRYTNLQTVTGKPSSRQVKRNNRVAVNQENGVILNFQRNENLVVTLF